MSNLHQPSIEEIFRVTLIDKVRRVKTSILLKDEAGDEIPIRETIEKLIEYISDKLKSSDPNTCTQQIMPLMAQAVAGGMVKLMGKNNAICMLSDEFTRVSLIHMMTVSFYLLKWIQQKGIKIHSIEEPVTEEDMQMYERCSKASDFTVQYAASGGDPREALREMLKRGMITQSDLTQLGAADLTSEELPVDQKDKGEKN